MLSQLSEEQAARLWAPTVHEQDWKPKVRAKVLETLEKTDTEMAGWLLGKNPLAEASVASLRELESLLETHTERNMLRDITLRIRGNLPSFPLARIAIEVKRAANPINPDIYTAERLRASEILCGALTRGYRLKKEQFKALNVRERIGLLLLSAAYSGGLLDADQLYALTRLDATDFQWLAGTPETRLTLSILGDKTAEFRQWFPDPATLTLLVRYMEDLKGEVEANRLRRDRLIVYINEFLKRGGIPKQYHPRNLSEMLLLVRMQLQLRLPPLLTSFACRDYVSHSLRPTNWGAIFGCRQQRDPDGTYAEVARGGQGKPEEMPPWVTALCAEIRKGELALTGSEQGASTSVRELMYSWANQMLNPTSPYVKHRGKRLEPDTVATYVRALGGTLDAFLGEQSVFELGSLTLETVYETALETLTNEKKQRVLGSAIREFHDYLCRVHKMPPISRYSVLSGSRSVTRVDARVLSEEQYQDVLRALERCGLEVRTPRLVLAAKLLFILGYRLGLRRSEALLLQLADVHVPGLNAEAAARVHRRHPNMQRLTDGAALGELPVDMIIRPNYERRLKTVNSVRRLPLKAMLEPSELALLLDWYKQRNREEADTPASQFLFCIPELRSRWISEDCLIPAIHSCMRSVTGCEEMRFHHLRHSCATWLTLKLMGAVSGKKSGLLLGELELTSEWLADTTRLERAFFPENHGPTRTVIHIVSAIMGHGKPKTTLLHYVHSMPWLMAQAWQWNTDGWLFNAHNLATMAGVSEPRRTTQTDEQYMLDIIGRIPCLRTIRAQRRRRTLQAPEPVKHDWAIQRVRRVETMLSYIDYAEKTGYHPEVDSFEFSDADRAGMLERARYIRDLLQHRLKPSLHAQGRTLTPERPQSGTRSDLTGYAQRLYRLLEGPEAERANRVLDFFIEQCWETETTLRFYRDRDEEIAKDYLWLLQSMEIKGRDIELIIYDSKTVSKTRTYWRTQVGGPRTAFLEHAPENPAMPNQHLGIRPVLRRKDGEKLYHYGSALRYLLLMASIDWHLRV